MHCLKIILTTLFFILGADLRGETVPPEDEAVEIIILLGAEPSQAARGNTTSSQAKNAVEAITDHARQFGATLRPQHPDTDDPEISGYFVLAAPSADDAERMIEALRDMDGVEAAYLKPQPAMP